MGKKRDVEAELNLPPGFRFHPTDEELVVDYLCRKVSHQHIPVTIIAEIDLYKYNPWELPDKALFGEKEWYFFTPRDRKYPNGSRPNRTASSGYWKATGADKPIRPIGSNRHVGTKKALVFYTGKAPKGIKTNWIMHEYRLVNSTTSKNQLNSRLDDWVLCRLYNKKKNWQNTSPQAEEISFSDNTDSFEAIEETTSLDTAESVESVIINDRFMEIEAFVKPEIFTADDKMAHNMSSSFPVEDQDWFEDLILDDLKYPHADLGPNLSELLQNDSISQGNFSSQLKTLQSNLFQF